MFVTTGIQITVAPRNKPTIKKIVGNVSIGDIVTIGKEYFDLIGGKTIVTISCDSCSKEFQRSLMNARGDVGHRCSSCSRAVAIQKMTNTVRTPEYRKAQSEGKIQFNKTDSGKESRKKGVEKFKQWVSSPDGQQHIQKCIDRLPRMLGTNHPRYNPNKRQFDMYKREVYQETKKHDLSVLENFDKPRGLCGVPGAYQLDHIISMKYGFENSIPASVIGHVSNLQFIPWEENRQKWHLVD